MSYNIVSLQLCLFVLLINVIKKLIISSLHLHLYVSGFPLYLLLKCSTCLSLVSSSTIKVVQCCIFFIFYTGKSKKKKKTLENILENTRISCIVYELGEAKSNYQDYLKNPNEHSFCLKKLNQMKLRNS